MSALSKQSKTYVPDEAVKFFEKNPDYRQYGVWVRPPWLHMLSVRLDWIQQQLDAIIDDAENLERYAAYKDAMADLYRAQDCLRAATACANIAEGQRQQSH